MKKVQVWFTIENDGAGGVSTRWFLSENEAVACEASNDFGEPTVTMVETFVGSYVHMEAIDNDV